jgi:hypothetical protein
VAISVIYQMQVSGVNAAGLGHAGDRGDAPAGQEQLRPVLRFLHGQTLMLISSPARPQSRRDHD